MINANNTKKSDYMIKKAAIIDEIMAENPDMGRREAGKLARERILKEEEETAKVHLSSGDPKLKVAPAPSPSTNETQKTEKNEYEVSTDEDADDEEVVDNSTVLPENYTKYMEFRKERVAELLVDDKYDPPLGKRQAGHIARTEWESHIAAKKPVKQKKAVAETGDEEVKNTKKEAVKPEKKMSAYKVFKNTRVLEIMAEDPEKTKREAGALAKKEWEETQKQAKNKKLITKKFTKIAKEAAKKAKVLLKTKKDEAKAKAKAEKEAKKEAKAEEARRKRTPYMQFLMDACEQFTKLRGNDFSRKTSRALGKLIWASEIDGTSFESDEEHRSWLIENFEAQANSIIESHPEIVNVA